MEHLTLTGSPKLILVNLVVAYTTLLGSFVLPVVAAMSVADWIVKILQIAALIFSIRASKNAMKNKNEMAKK